MSNEIDTGDGLSVFWPSVSGLEARLAHDWRDADGRPAWTIRAYVHRDSSIGQVWLYQYGGSKAVCMRSIELPGQQFTLRYDYTILPRIVRDVSGAFGLPPEITTAIVNLLIKAGAS